MNNNLEYMDEFKRGRLFYYKILRHEELINQHDGNRYHHFIYFRTDTCVITFSDGTTKTPSEGSICYIAPGMQYTIQTDDPIDFVSGIACYGYLADAFAQSCNPLPIHISVRPTAIDAFNNILDMMDEADTKTETINRMALAFYNLLVELVFAKSHIVETKPSIIAQKIKQYIESNIDSDISVTSIAKQFYLSETHVIRIFREKYGITPKQYILQAKINASKLLLLDTSLQIKEIAMTYHFADSYHFSHTFKRFTGLSPEKYRMREDERK